jgi:hypothetical protein
MQKRLASFIFLLFCAISSLAQTTESIIAQHIAAVGGESKWASIKSLMIESTLESGGIAINKKSYLVYGKNFRCNMLYSGRAYPEKQTNYFILAQPKKGWKYTPDNINDKVVLMDSIESKAFLYTSDIDDPLVNYKTKGITVQFLTTEFFNEQYYLKLLLKFPNGNQEYCYIDPTNYLIYLRVPLQTESELKYTYLEYYTHSSGIKLPRKIESSEGIIIIKQVEINPNIPPSLFTAPKM